MEEQKDRQCAHAGCPCPADPGSDYCSEQCGRKNGSATAECSCPHELCQQARVTTKARIWDGSYDPNETTEAKEKPLMDDWGKSDKH
jgi:hypothetical protein